MKPFENFQIRLNEPLGNPECPYAFRWILVLFGWSLRLHHWIGNDDPRAMHDHPWWFITLCLWGGYTDESEQGNDVLRIGNIRYRPAEWKHRVILGSQKQAWTLLLTGPKVRHWGFYINGRELLMRPLRFYHRYGHHPCDK